MSSPVPKIPIANIEPNAVEAELFEVRKTIYPRAVHGVFATWRWALIIFTQVIFYGLPWLTWNGRQAVLFDLGARRFYIFDLVLWPQDFIFLTGILIISALSLFLFTAVAGRLWCGYACPQTVYTELFMWIERHIEGDRSKRMKLDREPWSARKIGIKAAKHGVWIAVALWTGITFVGYFTPIRTLIGEFFAVNLGPWETFWVLFYGFATYGNAGWMREQVCKYMCPYARFQGVMFDPDTLIITYDPSRGEPRGSRSKSVDHRAKGLGDCVDCEICVQVCPTGIDIRNGLQYECIACGACIDGCDQVMDKMGYPRGLIRYSTENAMQGKYAEEPTALRKVASHVLRPRVLIYSAILGTVIAAMAVTLALRVPVKLNVLKDRANLVRETNDGWMENVYRLQIMNTSETPHQFRAVRARPAGCAAGQRNTGREHKRCLFDRRARERAGRPGRRLARLASHRVRGARSGRRPAHRERELDLLSEHHPMRETVASRAWYREPWPWLLAAGPLAVVVAGAVTVWLAVESYDGLVADDYYKQGLAINQVIRRDQAAAELGLRGNVLFNFDNQRVRVYLRSECGAAVAQCHPVARAAPDPRGSRPGRGAPGVQRGSLRWRGVDAAQRSLVVESGRCATDVASAGRDVRAAGCGGHAGAAAPVNCTCVGGRH